MKKTPRETASKSRTTKATKNLGVKPAKGGTVRGGYGQTQIVLPFGRG